MSTVRTRPAGSAASSSGSSGRNPLAAVLRARELGIVVALAILVAYTTIANPRFLSAQSVRDILLGASILAVLAVGQTIVIVTRNIDLSVGSVLGLTAFAVGTVVQDNPGLPLPFALLLGMAIGGVCGMVNAVLVRYGQVPALVVTLGTLYMFRGVTYLWAGGQQITADELPRSFLSFANETLLGVPWLVLIALLVTVAAGVLLRNYRVGRELYAMGSNPEAAMLAGISVGRNLLGAFTVSGALAGLAGVLFAIRFGTIDAAAGTGDELEVVAAAVVGGVAVFGGSGTVWGAALGALLLTVIGNSLAVLDINQFWQNAIVGALILFAIGVDRLVAARTARALKKRNSHVR
ncbi:ABC transporter permease [Actinophytocola xanthii]|uniref:Autoinducer 2 import system permease protein LsrC n=1 Tax=Actinophytocola xanthii TaxID=1912961 RepID=A0A1Q8CPR9_9PSEU|nr:ABC transporter permease [Actinophytocola xanthii]OLF16347.1 ATPase [Actinophytocola xanthii]